MTIRTKIIAATLVSCALLSGCLAPEKFTASVEFNDDLSYRYTYKGITAFVPMVMEMASKKRALTDADQRALAAEGQKFRAKNPDVQKMEYVGDARFNIEMEGIRGSGVRTELFQTLLIAQNDARTQQAVVAKMQSKDAKAMGDIGLKLDGKLRVKLPSKAKIVQTNGDVAKGLLGLGAQTVEWVIQKAETRPILVFTVDNQ